MEKVVSSSLIARFFFLNDEGPALASRPFLSGVREGGGYQLYVIMVNAPFANRPVPPWRTE